MWCQQRPGEEDNLPYRVVAFMVKVRLVEKRVNRKVGIVMVLKVMSQ
jgi:hypothetical protein